MSECVVRMEMPRVCITENGYYGYCPMDRVWCIERNAPPDITMREAYEAMTEKIPSWCPIICRLPEGHGRLVDVTKIDFVMFTNEDLTFRCGWNNGVRSVMQHAETIVPAERSEV